MLSYILDSVNRLVLATDGAATEYQSALAISILSVWFVIYLACFIFKGIGLYTISRREHIGKPFMAFIPFLSYYLLGKIVGRVKIFGYHVKNLGLITMIAYILYVALSLSYQLLMYWDNFVNLFTNKTIGEFPQLYGSVWVDVVLYVVELFVQLIYIVADVFLIMAFFRYYGKRNQLLYTLLSIFVSPLFGIFVFVVRKNPRTDLSRYMKMKFDSYNATRSNGGFNNPQNPFTRNYDDNPFRDYGGAENKSENKKSDDDTDVYEEYSSHKNSDEDD